MSRPFNVKVVVSSYDYNKTLDVWTKIKEFLKREFGEQVVAGAYCEQKKTRNDLYYGDIFAFLPETERKEGE